MVFNGVECLHLMEAVTYMYEEGGGKQRTELKVKNSFQVSVMVLTLSYQYSILALMTLRKRNKQVLMLSQRRRGSGLV